MEVTNHMLFPTRLVTIQFPETQTVNAELCHWFESSTTFSAGSGMHPDALNLLHFAPSVPAVARVRDMFLAGVKHWLAFEQIASPSEVDLVLFSNYAATGELTLVHNHNADLVGIYYVRTAPYECAPVPGPPEEEDYFEARDGVLVLHDPRFNANLAAVCTRDYLKIFPRPGLMLIFPAYVWHSVTPHLGAVRRLALSMNITLRWPGGPSPQRHTLP
jgi:hypothetical protein